MPMIFTVTLVHGRSVTPTGAETLAFGAGRWVRTEDGYAININAGEANGKLDASYANPKPLLFARRKRPATATPSSCFLNYALAATAARPTRSTTTRRAIA